MSNREILAAGPKTPKIRYCATGLLLAAAVVCPAQVTFTEYPIPTGASQPYGITKGPDGNLWFAETNANKIGRITPAGVFTEFPVPSGSNYGNCGSCPAEITLGPDSNLWFTEYGGGRIGKITPAGAITEYSIPSSNSFPFGIAAGPDGNLWFTETGVADGSVGPIGGNNIGRITTTGIITEFPIPTSKSIPRHITAGPDGSLWFTEAAGNNIGRITTAGAITEYPIPFSSHSEPITTGPDGNLWFADYFANHIGKITTAGVFSDYPIPPIGDVRVNGIIAAPDGNLWFTLGSPPDQIVTITTAGVITGFPIPTSGGLPNQITTGPDGNLWFTEFTGNKIGKLNLGPRYSVCLLYDPTKAVKSGATLPVKLELCDSSGNDLSSSSITVHAISITQASSSISGAVQDSGNANPDNDFRFDSTLGSTGGYIFNLSTKGLTTGTYNVNFTVTGGSFTYAAPFQVK